MRMPAMDDVMRLTRAGKVAEATALLRGGLGGGASPWRHPAQEPKQVRPLLDLVAPATKDGARSVPRHSNGTPVPAATARFEWRSVSNDAGSRRYKLYVPQDVSAAPRPLVLMLHGCTQSPDDFAAGTRMNALADELGFLVAYPEQRTAHNSSKCWNWFKPGDQRRGAGEPSLLAEVVEDVAAGLPVDRARVFVAGLSAGGAAAAIMAQEYPDLFRAAGIHSGLACGAARDLPSALAAMKRGARSAPAPSRTPLIVFHGSADITVNPANARHVLTGATAGCAAPAVEHGQAPGGARFTREVWRDVEGRPKAEAWTVAGVGHAWSGGSPAGSYTDSRGPDASRAMMRFFLDL